MGLPQTAHKLEAERFRARKKLFLGFKLCRKCFQVPWEQFDNPDAFPRSNGPSWPAAEQYMLGPIASVLRKSCYCVSCKFALDALRQRHQSDIVRLAEQGIIRYDIPYPADLFRENTLRGKPHPGHHNRERMNQLIVTLFEPITDEDIYEELLIATSTGSGRHLGERSDAPFTARQRLQVASITLLAAWLKECEQDCEQDQEHALGCVHVPLDLGQGPALKLVDVKMGCVIQMPPSQSPPRYAALSYVWGSTKLVQLTLSNLSTLTEKKSLWRQHLPQTLVDAMDLVLQLGERYLWIDALCIVQDDPEELQAIIPRMDSIYQGAVFTIIAAAGANANAGLSGLKADTRPSAPDLIPLGPLFFSRLMYDFADTGYYIDKTDWATRGWTFQEGVLSRRRLIFTNDQIYWSCSRFTRCEQITFEGTWFYQEFGRHVEVDQRTLIHTTWVQKDDPNLGIEQLLPYIRTYSVTSLRFPGDRLNAFKGVLSFTEKIEREKYFAALPQSRFLQALLWDTTLYTANADDTGPESSSKLAGLQRSFPFPSWSWLAWSGQVRFYKDWLPAFNTSSKSESYVKSLVKLLVIIDGQFTPLLNHEATEVDCHLSRGVPNAHCDGDRIRQSVASSVACRSEDSKFMFVDFDGQSNVLRDGRLFFWADTCTLEFNDTIRTGPEQDLVSTGGIKIRLSTGSLFHSYTGSHEFIAIAQTTDFREKITVLMEISQDRDGVAYRVTIGKILFQDWSRISSRKRKWIELA